MTIYQCSKCNTEFSEGVKFCQNCGNNIEIEFIETPTCPKCGKIFTLGTKFCDVDGSKLVSPEKLMPRCVKCGKEYFDGTKFCPEDGGKVMSEALKSNNDFVDFIKPFLETNILGKSIFIMGVLATLIDIYIILHFSSFSCSSKLFPHYLRYEVMGWIIFALLLSGAAKLIDEALLKLEDENKISKIGATLASVAGGISLLFLVLGLLSRVIIGY